eukprot:903105-Pyramimonas_sp.AAC.1
MLRGIECSCSEAVRYLGPRLTPTQSFQTELGRRIQAAKTAYFRMGRFWQLPNIPFRWKRCVLLCHVVNSALSAVECFIPSAGQL